MTDPLPAGQKCAKAVGTAPVSYALLVPTIYGQMLINRYDINQANALIKTCKGHDHHEIEMIAKIFDIIAPPFGVFIDVGQISEPTHWASRDISGRAAECIPTSRSVCCSR